MQLEIKIRDLKKNGRNIYRDIYIYIFFCLPFKFILHIVVSFVQFVGNEKGLLTMTDVAII